MRIGFDARFSRSPGVERYYTSLLRALADVGREDSYVAYHASQRHRERFNLGSNVSHRVLGVDAYALREQFVLSKALFEDRPDVFHSTNNWVVPVVRPWACPLVITLHDMCPKTHPELIKPISRLYAAFMYPWSIRAAKRILTVSEYSKNEIARYYPAAEPKIVITPNGVEDIFWERRGAAEIESVKRKVGIGGDYLLSVGALMKHKNILGLVSAFRGLPGSLRTSHSLVILGRSVPGHADYEAAVRAQAEGERIVVTSGVSTRELSCLYQGATAFVFPSRQEGFGIPLVEAMASGTPVASSNTTVMPEICRTAALLFDPDAAGEMRAAMEAVLSRPELRERLSVAGRERARDFSWENAARKTLKVYREAARVGRHQGDREASWKRSIGVRR